MGGGERVTKKDSLRDFWSWWPGPYTEGRDIFGTQIFASLSETYTHGYHFDGWSLQVNIFTHATCTLKHTHIQHTGRPHTHTTNTAQAPIVYRHASHPQQLSYQTSQERVSRDLFTLQVNEG